MRSAITASRTTPTLCVLVSTTGPSSWPDSVIHVVPVISPLPLSANQPPNTHVSNVVRPRGRIAVTPVRTLWPSGRSSINVTWPTVTPATSVIALRAPGVPSKGTPRSRARGSAATADRDAHRPSTSTTVERITPLPSDRCLSGTASTTPGSASCGHGGSWEQRARGFRPDTPPTAWARCASAGPGTSAPRPGRARSHRLRRTGTGSGS